MTIITKLKRDTLVWKKYPKKHPKRDGHIRAFFFVTLWLPIPTFQLCNCLLKILRIAHPGLPQIICPPMPRKPNDDPGKHSQEPALHIGDSVNGINGFLNILGVHIDDKLSFNDHPFTFLKKVYAKVGALRRLRKLVPVDISLLLYKAYILPHLEYCRPLQLGINKTLNKKLESANYYALKALLNFVNSLDNDSILSL